MKKSLVFIAFCLFASNLFAQEAKVVYSDFECIATCDNYNHTRTTIIPKDGWSDDVTLTCDGVERSFIVKVYGGAKKVLETFINRTVSKDEYKRSLFGYFSLDALNRPEVQLVSLTGKAGTGKTLLALAAALHQRKTYQQILLARPIVPLANKDIGFLPGDIKDKIGPYMQPLFDNLSVIKHKFKPQSPEFNKIEEMLKDEKLVITPLAYIRGRSLSNVFFIVDEAQNLTPHEVKTIITRAGEGTKIIFTGDIQQIDSPYLDAQSNGLTYLSDKMKGQDLFAHVNLLKGERSY